MNVQHVKIIDRWMLSVTKNGGLDRFDDLHIDQIDTKWKSRDHWIDGGVEAFRLAVARREKHRLGLTVALAFSLHGSDKATGVTFETIKELEPLFDWSPPSLYLFRDNQLPWLQTTGFVYGHPPIHQFRSANISPRIFGTLAEIKGCYYLEFQQEKFGEFSRSVFVAG